MAEAPRMLQLSSNLRQDETAVLRCVTGFQNQAEMDWPQAGRVSYC